MSIKKSIIKILTSNILIAVSSILVGFIVPLKLDIDAYAYLKTYTLYISYVGFFHFGFIDGLYIKYGGKTIEEVDKGVLKNEHRLFIRIQLIATLVFIIISIALKDTIIFLMALSIIPVNTISFHKLFYQATGEFDKFAKVSCTYSLIYALLNILLVFLTESSNYILFCLVLLFTNGVIFLKLEYKFYKSYKDIDYVRSDDLYKNIKVGFVILLANLSVSLFYGIDRWFIKIGFSNSDFSYYSFAVSMLNIVNLVVTSISVTFYNYLSKGVSKEIIKKLKNYFLLIGGGVGAIYFVFAFIVNTFIKKYIPSLSIISISFVAYPYMIVINSLYTNLYKSNKNEKHYLKVVIYMVLVAIVYNVIAVIISKGPIFIAAATTLSFMTWYIYSMKDFKYLKISVKEGVYLISIMCSFLIISHVFDYIFGGFVYLLIYVIISYCTLRKDCIELFNSLIKIK